jgi:uncharacterized protein YlzI (FlbEa/FlbD family)
VAMTFFATKIKGKPVIVNANFIEFVTESDTPNTAIMSMDSGEKYIVDEVYSSLKGKLFGLQKAPKS